MINLSQQIMGFGAVRTWIDLKSAVKRFRAANILNFVSQSGFHDPKKLPIPQSDRSSGSVGGFALLLSSLLSNQLSAPHKTVRARTRKIIWINWAVFLNAAM